MAAKKSAKTSPKSRVLAESRKRSVILATAAHDLRNPLSAVFGYAEVLLMEPGDQSLSTRQRELIHRIRGASLRGLELSKNLQSISEHATKRRRRTALSSLLGGIQAAIESVWFPPEKKLEFTLSSSIAATDRVALEQYELERLFGNLLSNAIKYSPADARIELRATRVGSQAVVSVFNSGSFVPLRERKGIFKLFVRGTHTHAVPGSGLGLAIVADLVRQAGGSISISSVPDRSNLAKSKLGDLPPAGTGFPGPVFDAGTMFKVVLPITTSSIARRDQSAATKLKK